MIVDSSALLSLVFREPAADRIADALSAAEFCAIGAPTLTETAIVLAARLGPSSRAILSRLVEELDLVIDDPRISRNHAQLRAIKGRYVIFDLNSTGGTFVNAQRTSQSVLYPGDVISLAGVPLIYGQDNPPPRPDLAGTEPFSKASSDRPTAFLNRQTGMLADDEVDQTEE